MVYTTLNEILRKKIHIITVEKFATDGGTTTIERFVGKHPLLKPELIVVNDQPYGFKKLKKEFLSLENYPIYFEIEISQTEEDGTVIENFELYTETKIALGDKTDEVIKLNKKFDKSISVEQIRRLNEPGHEILVIYSKLNELFYTQYLEEDVHDGLVNEQDILGVFEQYIDNFVAFITGFDDIVSKNKTAEQAKLPDSIF